MRLTALAPAAAVAAVIAVAGCSPAATPTPPPDPVSVLTAGGKASYPTKLEFAVSGSYTAAGTTASLPDKALTIDVDTAARAGSVHLALPASLLGADGASALKQLGVTGDSITFDVLFDGNAVYAKSPLLPAVVAQLAALAPGQNPAQVGADTWAKLIDEATLKQYLSAAAGAVESAAPSASASLPDMKSALDAIGATLTLAAQTTGAGGPANDVKISVDPAKLKAYMLAHPERFPSTQLSTISALGELNSISADILVDAATSRVEQVSFTVAATQGSNAVSVTGKVTIAEAPASVSFAAPSGAVDLPLVSILAPIIGGMLGGGGLPIPTAAP